MRDVIIISTNYWDGEWFRKQQFALRFAERGHRVLFVEPSHSLVRPVVDRPYVTNRPFASGVRLVAPRLWVLTPPRLLPGVTRVAVSRLNHLRLAGIAARRAAKLGFVRPLTIVYDVEMAYGLALLPRGPLAVDLVDDLVAYETKGWRKNAVTRSIERLVARTDYRVFTTSGLMKRYGQGHGCVVPNGYDARLFDPDTVKPDIRAVRGRSIGFVGTLFRHLDFDLIERVAVAYPSDTLVLVGRDASGGLVERLCRLENVVHVPAVERSVVPSFIRGFDVCLVPFRDDDVSANVSPLKAYEYLAMQRPVVSVKMPSLAEDPVASSVLFADGPESFVRLVGQAMRGEAPTYDPELIASASWDGRFEALYAHMADSLETVS